MLLAAKGELTQPMPTPPLRISAFCGPVTVTLPMPLSPTLIDMSKALKALPGRLLSPPVPDTYVLGKLRLVSGNCNCGIRLELRAPPLPNWIALPVWPTLRMPGPGVQRGPLAPFERSVLRSLSTP